jgi:chromosome segregation ATPase
VSDSSPPGAGKTLTPGLMLLAGAVLALLAGFIYVLYQIGEISRELEQLRDGSDRLRSELAQTREELRAEIDRNSTASTEANRNIIDTLKKQLFAARQQASTAVGQAQVSAAKRADELAAQLEKVQQDQAQKVAAVSDAVSQVKTEQDATKSRVGEVSNEVGAVRTEISATKSDLERVIEGLKTARGDLDGQSALIATNARELEALKARGERSYMEFTLPKEKAPRKFGDVLLRLTASDPKRNRYTVEVIADDKRVEKKDKTINEPLQFYLSRSPLPYELVVNEVKKDTISGYVSAPKAQPPRN